MSFGFEPWVGIYTLAQLLYFSSFVVTFYFLTRPVNWVDTSNLPRLSEASEESLPLMVLAYPVLREDYATMHSTMLALAATDYPRSRYRIIAIPNDNDDRTIGYLRRLQMAFSFLEIMAVPPTTDPRWDTVWRAWEINPKCYWFHVGRRRGRRDLPPKKTRQLVYLLYTLIDELGTDWVLDYIDADSMPPPNHFRIAAEGLKHYDVLQSQNVAGNILDSMAATLHSLDHMIWDGMLYPHMSANGTHPYYVLGKGLFYRASDLLELGGFNPWITIEDPEVGMRFWTNGRRLGIIREPLIEEVPRTFYRGIIQRNRWMCGFFQSLASPLKRMGMPFWRRMQARLNIVPVLTHPVHVIGIPTGTYALYLLWAGANPFPLWLVWLSLLNIGLYVFVTSRIVRNAYARSKLVLRRKRWRIWYVLRINPLAIFFYHTLWIVPIVIGFLMFLTDRGKTWLRTKKFDADRRFVERRSAPRPLIADAEESHRVPNSRKNAVLTNSGEHK